MDRRNEAKQQPFYCCAGLFTDSLRDAIALRTTDLNYGLQPVAGDSVKMQVLMDHYNQLQLTLEDCHAVTPNGIRIQISASQEGQTLTLSKDMTEMKGNASFSVITKAENSEKILL